MIVPPFPEAYIARMRSQLGDTADGFFLAMEEPPCRGLRLNPNKTPEHPLHTYLEGLGECVVWEPNGLYLAVNSRAGAHTLHEAGAYYLQEPSAMLPATLLNVQPGETVLDLCAAPGGKSTQLAASLAGSGLLVANEIVPSRAQVLSRNLERMGTPNALAVSADPAKLAQVWPLLFDAVLIDAPCSGEGMFRRHPEARLEWDEASPARCAVRQLKILESACAMLKPGGRLCYSTCTFSPEENEGVVAALIHDHPELEPVAFQVPVAPNRCFQSNHGGVRLMPHEVAGEGQFAALFLKTGSGKTDSVSKSTLLPASQALNAPLPALTAAYRVFCADLGIGSAPAPTALFGDTLISAPDLPPLRGIRVLRAGLALGQLKGRVFTPDYALAMVAPAIPFPSLPLTPTQASRYLAGETLPAPGGTAGYYTVTLAGLPLGFVKVSDGQMKNHYPKGLRRTTIAAENGGESNGED